jgi:hypothetical protein
VRVVVSFVLGLLLALSGCGDGDTPQQSSQKRSQAARAPVVEPASEPEPTPAPAAEPSELPAPEPVPEDVPGPAKGGDEEFQPPSNWCGTGRIPSRAGLEGAYWLYENEKGEKRYVPEGQVTGAMVKELKAAGWKFKRVVGARERWRIDLKDLKLRMRGRSWR